MLRSSIHSMPARWTALSPVWCFSPQWSNQPTQYSPHISGTPWRNLAKLANSPCGAPPKLITLGRSGSVPPASMDGHGFGGGTKVKSIIERDAFCGPSLSNPGGTLGDDALDDRFH